MTIGDVMLVNKKSDKYLTAPIDKHLTAPINKHHTVPIDNCLSSRSIHDKLHVSSKKVYEMSSQPFKDAVAKVGL